MIPNQQHGQMSGEQKDSARRRAFTLIELLVVTGIIGILAAMLFPALAGIKERGIRVKCLSNVKQCGYGIIMYGGENNDRFPLMNSGYWAWDIPDVVFQTIQRCGFERNTMYDPGFPEQNNDTLWIWQAGYHVIGYAVTFPNTASVAPENQNPGLYPGLTQVGPTWQMIDTSRRVLLAGSVITHVGENDPLSRTSYHYTDIYGGWGPHRTAHLNKYRNYPTGDNVGMLDGSAKWRKFQDMLPRTSATNTPVFWW